MADKPVLYTYWRSSCSWRVRIALNMKGIEYESKPVHLVKDGGEQHKDDYKAINEQELVPTLDIDGHKLTQSLAIIEYLDATRPDVPIVPKDPFVAATARKIAMNIACETQPIQNLRVLQYVEKDTGVAEKKAEWAKYWITKGLTAVETCLKESAGTCCVGDDVTIADLCLVPQIYNAERYAVDMSAFPTITKVHAHLATLPHFIAAHPDKQPDAQ